MEILVATFQSLKEKNTAKPLKAAIDQLAGHFAAARRELEAPHKEAKAAKTRDDRELDEARALLKAKEVELCEAKEELRRLREEMRNAPTQEPKGERTRKRVIRLIFIFMDNRGYENSLVHNAVICDSV